MILFYTGAVKSGDLQVDPQKSLGGYFSNSIIPNGSIGSIFTSLSNMDQEEKTESIRAIGLKNTLVQPVLDVKIYITAEEDARCDYQLGLQTELFQDNCNELYTEVIQTERQTPYYIEFNSYTEQSPLVIDQLSPGGVVALWIKRIPKGEPEVVVNPADAFKNPCTITWERLQDDLENKLTIDGFTINIVW